MNKLLPLLLLFSYRALALPFDVQVILPNEDTSGSGGLSYSNESDPKRDTLTTNLLLQYRGYRHLGLISNNHNLISSKSESTEDLRTLTHFRSRAGDNYGFEAFYQFGFDVSRDIMKSESYGYGPHIKLKNDLLGLALGTALTRENETYVREPPTSTNRLYTYASGDISLPSLIKITSTIFLESNTQDRQDYRLFYNAGIKYRSPKGTTVGTTCESFFDTVPPSGLSKKGYRVKTMIGIDL